MAELYRIQMAINSGDDSPSLFWKKNISPEN